MLDWLSEMTLPICIPFWVRQGTETNYFNNRIQELRNSKANIFCLIREGAAEHNFHPSQMIWLMYNSLAGRHCSLYVAMLLGIS